MSLSGTRLGAYEILDRLGAGGMGEVYRARDTTLERDVAIKALPAAFSADPDRTTRFRREAQILAALNHPNIAAIYGVEEAHGARFLILELVEGETLEALIGNATPSVKDALAIARQIADALEAAHERGIVHRDLKPSNIAVTRAGQVKVLDFGLAKLVETTPASSDSFLPTVASPPPVTQAGAVLGTAAYMSPEQARGREADKRSDVWAFGCVLFELLSGRRAFGGSDTAETLAALLRDEPDWSALPPATPPSIRRLLRRCLARDRTDRLGDIQDARLEIVDAFDERQVPTQGKSVLHRFERLAWLTALVIVLVTAFVARRDRSPDAAPESHVEISTPPTTDPASMAISPDGRTLAFVADSDGQPGLWIRKLGERSAHALPDTDNARYPFWSPDSRSIAFFVDAQLKRIDIDGGLPRVLASAPGGVGGSWGPGVILFSMLGNPVYRIPPDSGDGVKTPVTTLASHQGAHYSPQILPDGRHFLFWAVSGREPNGVFVGDLAGKETRRLLDSESAAVFAPPGHLLFIVEGNLWARRFDVESLSLVGSPFRVADRIPTSLERLTPATSAAGGVIAYRSGQEARKRLAYYDRSGREENPLGDPFDRTQLSPVLSPDGRRVALFRGVQGNIDVWLLDATTGVPAPFTHDSADDVVPVWSPLDSNRFVFSSNRRGVQDLYLADIASGQETLLFDDDQWKVANDWSRDGRSLLFQSIDPKRGTDLWILPLNRDGRRDGPPQSLVQTDFEEHGGKFSPDGKWIAYVSSKSTRFEIYVRRIDAPASEKRVSPDGGNQVRWGPGGDELFYVARDGRLTNVKLRFSADGNSVEADAPIPLFESRIRHAPTGQVQYAVSRDGQRFLINAVIDDVITAPIQLILNWKPAADGSAAAR